MEHFVNMIAAFFMVGLFLGPTSMGIDLNSNSNQRRRFDLHQPDSDKIKVSVAVVLPHSMFKQREYKKIIGQSALKLHGSYFEKMFDLSPYLEMMQPIPAPTEVLGKICDQFLANNTAAILYLTDSENYGQDSVASQYFMQLAQYVRLPLISWNADNSAFEMGSLQLQLAPTLKQQASAMLAILERYSWNTFSIVTGEIAGHSSFEIVVRELTSVAHDDAKKKTIVDSISVRNDNVTRDMAPLARTESRVFLLYGTRQEAIEIMKEAEKLGLTNKTYVWIASQAIIGSDTNGPEEFPVGMLGVHFKTDRGSMIQHLHPAMSIVGKALDSLSRSGDFSHKEKMEIVQSNVSCHGKGEVRWTEGEKLFKFLKNVSVPPKNGGMPFNLEFNNDGSLKTVELFIVNLQLDAEASKNTQTQVKRWEEIGTWQAFPAGKGIYNLGKIDIKDIVWPGNALKPPEGIPEKRFLRVSFMEEDPYVMLDPPSATCLSNKGVFCRLKHDDQINRTVDWKEEEKNEDSEVLRCCSGFCVDLLRDLSEELSFDFVMTRVKDGKWGGIVNGSWNGLVAELINHDTDVVMTSLKINSGRETVIDFSVPFLETGITILVAKKTGIISPTAFLEPFSPTSWAIVALVAVHLAAGCIFLFEWLSPAGYDMKYEHPHGQFSFLRVLWLVWAVLFQAAVNVDCPRGYAARLMAHVWAMFALIFLAIYTANLAAFMITREEFPNLSGLDDSRLSNPMSHKPSFRFATIPNGATDFVLKNNFPSMQAYMQQFKRTSVKEGFRAVKNDQLDAFVYDATVLEYLVGQDDECNVLTVGSWYAMTGYGVAFPKNSMWIQKFNEKLMNYRQNGDLERMQRFWFTGACDPREKRRTSSKPLALAQFMSAFLLLFIGVIIAVVLALLECFYFKYFRKIFGKCETWMCCNLLSIDLANSIQKPDNTNKFEEKIQNPTSSATNRRSASSTIAQQSNRGDMQQSKSCVNPGCGHSIQCVTQDLHLATQRIKILQNQLEQLHQRRNVVVAHPNTRNSIVQHRHGASCMQNVSEIETVL